MGGSSGGGGTNTTVTKSDPWAGQQPYLQNIYGEAQNWYNSSEPAYYEGSTVADLGPTTQQAIDLQTSRALSGSPLTSQGQGLIADTLAGDYLTQNPYVDAVFNQGADQIKKNYWDAVNGTNSGASSAGRYGSGMQAYATDQAGDTLAKNLGDLYNQTYYSNYQTERGNQNAALSSALNYANQDYTDLAKLAEAGAVTDEQAQALIDADINKWNYNQNLKVNKLGQYLGLIGGNYGGSTSTQTPVSGQSWLGTLAGLGAMGYGMASGS